MLDEWAWRSVLAAVLALFSLCGLTSGCVAAAASSPTTAAGQTIDTITAISLERNCFGCPSGSVFVLRRDGTVTLTVAGTARSGTPSQTSTGRVSASEFDRIAQLVVSGSFFTLNDSYAEPGVQDGAWTKTIVTRGGVDKSVFRRENAGPAALRAVEAALDALQARSSLVAQPR